MAVGQEDTLPGLSLDVTTLVKAKLCLYFFIYEIGIKMPYDVEWG